MKNAVCRFPLAVIFRAVMFVSAISFPMLLQAQSIKVDGRFGKVSEDEVKMTEYPQDTSAAAIVLYEKGTVMMEMHSDGTLVKNLYFNARYKILKEQGTEYADFEVPFYWQAEYKEHVTGINVVSWNMVNGKMTETRMPKSLVFEETVSDNMRCFKFTAPDVRAGTVIDVQYRISSELYWIFDDIYFQQEIPVNEIEYEIRLPDMFMFSKHLRGYLPVSYSESSGTGRFMVMGNSFQFTEIIHKYRGTDLPAMKKEPGMYNARQYMSAVSYDLMSFQIPGYLAQNFSVTWQDVDDDLLESSLGKAMKTVCPFKKEVDAIMAAESGDEDGLIMAICSMVKENVAWNGKVRLYPGAVGTVVKEKSGSNAGINAVIASALSYAGFKVEPVVLRSRTSGFLLDYRPEMTAFDTFILRVETPQGKVHYVDGMSYNGYMDILPEEFLVPNARILRPGGRSEWVDITGLCRNSIVYVVNAGISGDVLAGTVQCKMTGEESFSFKSEYKGFDTQDEFLSSLENETSSDIGTFSLSGMQGLTPACSFEYDFTKKVSFSGDFIYINPFLFEFHHASTFREPERKYPVDFPYRTMISYFFRFNVPEGYVVEQLPENIATTLESVGSSVRVISTGQGTGPVSLRYDFRIDSMRGDASEYEYIRQYWEHLSNIYDGVIVLRKSGEENR
ncbi:MAG: hypothetical protein IAC23_10240 [Bacteroidetes bacterium]|uniref:DUF3857 domain-containing protein n=1 Tax=Candidatus Cryptobacteroides merdavium TaxID=2840769 RepID=A0A9D9EFS9_9BACT|nr:hypothetical protein [Candidatus Cryptobacteroides merdavium]